MHRNIASTDRPCLLALLVCLASLAPAAVEAALADDPEYIIDTWETEDGLPQNSATAMAQTPDGYLWFGTFGGLVRFDGVRFTIVDPHNTPQLPSAAIVSLHADRRGWLWVGTTEGLVARTDAGWRSFTGEGWPSGRFVRNFAERKSGELLVTTSGGAVLEFTDDRFRRLPDPPGVTDGCQAYLGSQEQWGVANYQFIGQWDGTRWSPTVSLPDADDLAPLDVHAAPAHDGGWWMLHRSELRKYRGGTEVSRLQLSERPGDPWRLFEDSRGNVWICTQNKGLCRVSPDGTMRRWNKANGLLASGIRFVYEDRERNLWVGTDGAGLMRFKERRCRGFGFESGLTERVVTSLAAHPDGSLWVATWGRSLFRLKDSVAAPIQSERPTGGYVESVLIDREARIWASTYQNGLWISEGGDFRQVPPQQLPPGEIRALFEDSRGRIWIGSADGIGVFDSETFRRYERDGEWPSGGAVCFAEDPEGAIWCAGSSGVFRLGDDRPVELKDSADRSLTGVVCLKFDSNGTLWMGTERSGLLRHKNGKLSRIDEDNGLPVSNIRSILEDDKQVFWMSSRRGIVRAERSGLEAVADGRAAHLRCQHLDTRDGLPSIECAGGRQPNSVRDNQGRLWFPTLKGVAMIQPERFELNDRPPRVRVENVVYHERLGGHETRTRSGEAGRRLDPPFDERLVIPAGSRRIEVRYTAFSYTAPERLRFQVRLEGKGKDDNWFDAGGQRTALFHDLSPGRYLFRVRAVNHDGVPSEVPATLAFSVQPFFWQTNWFRTGLVLLLVGAGGAAAWWHAHRKHRREIAELERTRRHRAELTHLARLSTMGELAASVAHELNQPLGAIHSNADAAELLLDRTPPDLDEVRTILRDIRTDDERATEVISRMRRFLRKGEIDRQPLQLNDTINDVLRVVRADAAARQTTIDAQLAPSSPPVLGDSIHLQQVLLNLVLNGIDAMSDQPPEQRRLTVRSAPRDDQQVEVAVSDRGPGLDEEHRARLFEPFFTTKAHGMGLGLSIARTILEAHHGRLWVENNPDGGATFRFTVPLAETQSA